MNHRLLIQASRIGLYTLVVVLTLFNHLAQDNFFNWSLMRSFYGLSALGLLLNLLPLFALEKFFRRRALVFATFFLDILLISSLMATTSLNQTMFLFMYLVIIILSGLVFQMRGALLVAAFSSVAFTMASWFGPEVKAMAFLFILILNNIAFFAVAGLAGYLSEQLNFFAEKLEAQNLSLRVVRKLNEMIIETIPSALLTVNSLSEILQFNPQAAVLFQKEELEGMKIFDLLPELGEKIDSLPSLRVGEKHEVRFSPNNNDEVSLLGINILPQVSDFEVPTFLVVLEDLTQVRRLEFAVRQSEKMAAVGGLAAGIAHEIRNPLAGISGSVELLSQNFTGDDDKKLAKIIMREIDRLNRLISEFLDFAKPEKPPVDAIEINSLLREVIENAKASSPLTVDIQLQLSSQNKILGHGDKLRQALLNIIINSFQAMVDTPKPCLQVSTLQEEGRLVLRVKDNGSGMKSETRRRMFEPFHTTKPKGTGLGLAITHKILDAHGAQIFVESEQGLGTEFVISFPVKSFENQRPAPENKI